jgi:hypothetical protein
VTKAAGPDRKPLVAGNWKLHNNHLEAIALTQKIAFTLSRKDFDAVEVAVLPPFTALRSVQTLVQADKLTVSYGAQDISPHDSGAYTGEVSGPMLAKLGCRYALAGHSERRQYHHEDDALVSAKATAAVRAGLTPIVCVGEPLEIREAGGHLGHCLTQLDAGRADRGAGRRAGRRLRAGMGHRHRQGGEPGGRAGDLRRDPGTAYRCARHRGCLRGAYPVWRVGEGRQYAGHHGPARYRRRAGRRGQPRCRRICQDLPVP